MLCILSKVFMMMMHLSLQPFPLLHVSFHMASASVMNCGWDASHLALPKDNLHVFPRLSLSLGYFQNIPILSLSLSAPTSRVKITLFIEVTQTRWELGCKTTTACDYLSGRDSAQTGWFSHYSWEPETSPKY